MVRYTGLVLIILSLLFSMVDCRSKPKACPTCGGTGKVSKSEEKPYTC